MVAGIVPALGMTPHPGLPAPSRTTGRPQPRQGDPLELYTTFLRKKPSKR